MALEVKLKNLVVETLNTENVSKTIFGDGSQNTSLDSQQSQFIISNGYFSTAGDAQNAIFLLRGHSTDASETELFLDGTNARFVLEDNTSYFFNGCAHIIEGFNVFSFIKNHHNNSANHIK